MKIVSIREAKIHLSSLIDGAVLGESFMIAKDGKPLVQVTAIGGPLSPRGRLGFLTREIKTPDDFDRMGAAEIEDLFEDRR